MDAEKDSKNVDKLDQAEKEKMQKYIGGLFENFDKQVYEKINVLDK